MAAPKLRISTADLIHDLVIKHSHHVMEHPCFGSTILVVCFTPKLKLLSVNLHALHGQATGPMHAPTSWFPCAQASTDKTWNHAVTSMQLLKKCQTHL